MKRHQTTIARQQLSTPETKRLRSRRFWGCHWMAACSALGFASTAVCADTLTLNPDAGLLQINGGPMASSVQFRGVRISADTTLSSGTRTYRVHGDFNVLDGDVVTATPGSRRAVRFLVGNDVTIAPGAVFDFGAIGMTGRAGGGNGSAGGAGISEYTPVGQVEEVGNLGPFHPWPSVLALSLGSPIH